MFYALKQIVPLVAVCSLIQAYCADSKEHKAWISQTAAEHAEAFTTNESESTLGVLCGSSGCRFYLLNDFKCDADSLYPMLANGDKTMHVMAKCGVWGSGATRPRRV